MTDDQRISLGRRTPDEIDIILDGDRRAIDRLILHALNDLIGVLIPHMENEERWQRLQGTSEQVRVRIRWVEAQIERQRARNAMMSRVVTAVGIWGTLALLAFVGWALWDSILAAIKARNHLP